MKYFISNSNLRLNEVSKEIFDFKVEEYNFAFACNFVMLSENGDLILLPTENVRMTQIKFPELDMLLTNPS